MTKLGAEILAKSFLLTSIAAILGMGTNLVRSDGIPLVTDIPYEIFAPCRDSEVRASAWEGDQNVGEKDQRIIYVDARPKELFEQERVQGAFNVPYSPLFGADRADIANLALEVKRRKAEILIVYGTMEAPRGASSEAPANPSGGEESATQVDLSRSLAEQLMESGLANVKHVKGGLAELNRMGAILVKADEEGTGTSDEQ